MWRDEERDGEVHMLFSDIDILDDKLEHRRGMYVGIRDGLIAYVGDKAPEEDFGESYDGQRKLLMSGMFNVHAHAPMTLLRGYAENLPLQRWLTEMVFPFEAQITDEDARPATDLAIAEMLRTGTVSFSDMYFFDDARAQAVLDSGIKCNLCRSISCFDPDMTYEQHEAFSINEQLIDDYQNAGDGRLKIDLCVHSEYTTMPRIVEGVAQSAADHGLGIQLHLSETKSEHEECMQRHEGLTPTAYFEKLGIFDSPVTAAHCVWCTEGDLDILMTHGATIATCPASNMKLGSGFLPLRSVLAKGVRLGLGTDGVASNNAYNMFREMYLLSIIHRGFTNDPLGISPEELLAVATGNGAAAQGRLDTGSLAVGKRADLIVVDLDNPWMQPVSDLRNNVVYSGMGTDVVLTMVDGEVLYQDGEYKTIDIERAMAQTQTARDRIVAAL